MLIIIKSQLPVEIHYRLSLGTGPISASHIAQPTGKISYKMAKILHHLEAMLTHSYAVSPSYI